MSLLADWRVSIGELPPGPTNSVHDVAGVGVGHATVWRDEPAPPGGRGVARTGVTVVRLAENAFRRPLPAGSAVLAGAGECTGLLSAAEWGLVETPIVLTSTMQLGRAYDAAVGLLVEEDAGIGVDDVAIPVVAECDDSFLSESRIVQISHDDVRAAWLAARAAVGGPAPARGAVGAGTGMSCFGWKGGIGTASRVVPDGHLVGALVLANFGEAARLTVAGVPVGRSVQPPAGEPVAPSAGSCIVLVATDGDLDATACRRVAQRATLGLGRTGSTGHHASGEIVVTVATGLAAPRGAAPDRPPVSGSALDPYFAAAVEAVEEAVIDALLSAKTVVGRDGNRSLALPHDAVRRLVTGARHGS